MGRHFSMLAKHRHLRHRLPHICHSTANFLPKAKNLARTAINSLAMPAPGGHLYVVIHRLRNLSPNIFNLARILIDPTHHPSAHFVFPGDNT